MAPGSDAGGWTQRLAAAVRSRARRWGAIARLLRTAGGGVAAAGLLLNLVLGALPVAFMAATGLLIARAVATGGAGGPAGPEAFWWAMGLPLAAAAGAFAMQLFLGPLQFAVGELIARRVDRSCIARLMTAATTTAPVSVMEEPATLNVIADAREAIDRDAETPGGAVAGALALIARYGQLAGAMALVGFVLSPWWALPVGVTALIVRFGQRGSLGRFGQVWDGLAGPRRKASYLRELGSGPAIAKEARILGITGWLVGRYRGDSSAYLTSLWKGRREILLRPFLWFAGFALVGALIGAVLLARGTAAGSLSALQLAIGIQALLIAIRFGVFFPESDVQTQYGLQAYEALNALEARSRRSIGSGAAAARATPRTEAETEARTGAGAEFGAEAGADVGADVGVAAPDRRPGAIRFSDVSFRYREDQPLVLAGLDLELPLGGTTAMVGLNGAGKTTLVKLLTRLHEPTSGRITWGELDSQHVDPAQWQRRFAVLSQGYGKYEMTPLENIAIGSPEHLSDEAGAIAAADRAGIGEFLRTLPRGFQTLLARQYTDGTDLSGGQWQRLALARSLFAVAHGASVLVLDEPTAHLDIRAEAEFFDRFLALTEGTTNLLISHRFATVRRADQILVLAGGRIIERGSHDELMSQGGQYAELFQLQARRFQDDPRLAMPEALA